MKKILLFITFLTIPFIVNASDVDYEIKNYYVSAKLDIAGSMDVKELIVLDGTFNGYERDILYQNSKLKDWQNKEIDFASSSIYNASPITNIKISGKYLNSEVSFDTFAESFNNFTSTSVAFNVDSCKYVLSNITDGTRLRMYFRANSQKVAFLISYTIPNVAVMHNDVAEVYWQFIGQNFDDFIDDVKIQLLLPNASKAENFKVWAHGNLSGNVTRLLDKNNLGIGASAEITNLNANSPVDIRMTFDKDVIEVTDFIKKSNINALDKISEVENERAAVANKQRQAIKNTYYFFLYSTIIYIIALIILWIFIYFKYDKEYKSDFSSKYYREFIEDYDVEVVDYLLKKNISPNAMSASIMNLIYKKKIKVEELTSDKKNKKEYLFTLIDEKKLSNAEEKLVELLFNDVGENKTFTTKQLKDYAKSSATYSNFSTSYNTWQKKVTDEGIKQEFYEENSKIKLIGTIYFVIGMILFWFSTSKNVEIFTKYIVLILSILFLIYVVSFTRRTKKGNDHYRKWMAFKNFLNDFSILKEREIPEIALWERYMVYATVLGVADKVSKAMNVRIAEFDPNHMYAYSPTFSLYMHMQLHNVINTTVANAIRENISKANANSSSSSGGGFGGGFSSGGGFGGGGGGGRGF